MKTVYEARIWNEINLTADVDGVYMGLLNRKKGFNNIKLEHEQVKNESSSNKNSSTENIEEAGKRKGKYKQAFKVLGFIAFTIIFIIIAFYINKNSANGYNSANEKIEYERAKVVDVLKDETTPDPTTENVRRGSQDIKVKVLSGEHKGEVFEVTNYLSALYNVYVQKGTQVIVRVDTKSATSYNVQIYNFNRMPVLGGFVFVFCVLLCLIGGKKGAKALGGLLFTLFCVLFILLPLLLKGYPTILVAFVIVFVTTIYSLLLLAGMNHKSFSAIVGTLCGVLFAGACAYGVGALVKITGFQMDDAEVLMQVGKDWGNALKIKDLLVAGILISSLGGIMDVAMTISSAMYEMHQLSPGLSKMKLFQSGMNVGKDAMGTMANTLILAFTGNSLNLMLMIYSYGIPVTQLMNTDLIAIEIIRAIAGSIGIICTVPIIAFVCAYLTPKDAEIKVL